jgi:UDP-N-acetylglucosamine diphosphorylase/glucosamine-1-phosphate N-acetyltransferase
MTDAIIFDDGEARLGPQTDLRASFDVRTGALTSLERLTRLLGLNVIGLVVPAGLAVAAREAHGGMVHAVGQSPAVPAGTLVVNGRCAVAPAEIVELEPGQCLIDKHGAGVVAARLSKGGDYAAFFGDPLVVARGVCGGGGGVVEVERSGLLTRPWSVREFRDQCITTDLLELAAGGELEPISGVTVMGEAPVLIRDDEGARVCPGVIIDAENGPVVIDEHATVRPGSVIVGPAYVGRHSTVLDRSMIKANTAIGPFCKVAGEVGGTIFQSHSNKGHDGHLGDAWVGQWANLGAGTTNSNLLNTYGEVLMRAGPSEPLERTGQQFMGCVVGDHVKTAICTRVMTGCTLHTGAMWASGAAASGNVPAFAWVTDEHPAGTKRYRLDKFLDVMRTVMARRKVVPGDGYVARVGEVYSRG